MKKYLLCTDLDGTLIPNGSQPEAPTSRDKFKRLLDRNEILLAYVTGRHRALVELAISDFDLPMPDIVIADVGTTIYQIDSSGWSPWDSWGEQIGTDWHGLSHAALYNTLSVFPMLRLQEKTKQNLYKLSFYVDLDTDLLNMISEIHAQLRFCGVKANLIWSIDVSARTGLLDVLPESANKLHAIRFLMQEKGFTRINTLFAGDSGNDLDVLLSDEIPAVLVANAEAEVKERMVNANRDFLYMAKGGFLGMNGNYSAGILEGAGFFWPEVGKWLREMA